MGCSVHRENTPSRFHTASGSCEETPGKGRRSSARGLTARNTSCIAFSSGAAAGELREDDKESGAVQLGVCRRHVDLALRASAPLCYKGGRAVQVEEFWQYYSYMVRPNDLPITSDYHLFRAGIKPIWEVLIHGLMPAAQVRLQEICV